LPTRLWSCATGRSPDLDRDAIVEWIRLGWSDRLPIREVHEARPRQTLAFPSRTADPGATIVHERTLVSDRQGSGRQPTATLDLDGVESLLRESVRRRTDADVPLGCFLSGGIDSSLLSVFAKEAMGNLTTLTVKFPIESYDESPYAQEVADHLGTNHVVIDVDPSASDDFVRIVETIGLPFGDSSVLAAHWVSRAAQQEVKVALEGSGGDELFFGYRRHKACLMLKRIAPLLHLAPRRTPGFLASSGSKLGRLARFAATARTLGYRSMLSWQVADVEALIPSERDRFRRMSFDLPDPAMDDYLNYLPFDLLRKGDTASMLAPIEVRAPFLALPLVNAAQAQPIDRLMMGGQLKGMLRELLRRHIPSSIVDRPKRGFAVPVGSFFTQDFGGMGALMRDALAGERPFGRVHDVVDIRTQTVRDMVDQHTSGARDHSARLFNLVSLAIWARWLDAATTAATATAPTAAAPGTP